MGNIVLPQEFLLEMQKLLPEQEYQDFLHSFQESRTYGLRRNPLKLSRELFEEKIPFTLSPIPWTKEGYFYASEEQPGKSLYHEAGAYYIQEPSAMEVVELLDPQPEEYILDLCAAPGGKSSQIAGRLAGTGLLVSNEYVSARAKILAQNLERMGTKNVVIYNEDTAKLAKSFPLFFDRIVVDAPCSGEGMFRKDETAISEWSPQNVQICVKRQMEILTNAAAMLKPGGVLVYSTCTFSPLEDEGIVLDFLKEHLEFSLDESVPDRKMTEVGIVCGKHPKTLEEIHGTVRMWPHKIKGEGHFAAKFIKSGTRIPNKERGQSDSTGLKEERKKKAPDKAGKQKSAGPQVKQQMQKMKDFETFCKETFSDGFHFQGEFQWFGDQLYLMPTDIPINGLKVERAGLHMGTAKKNRFEPSHTLAMTLDEENVRYSAELQNPAAFLRGETDFCENEKGWTLALVDGISLGWGKAHNGILKNHYPKGLRKP